MTDNRAAWPRSAKDRLILALDTDNLDQARRLIEDLREYVGVFKVGLQLFCSTGPAILDTLKQDGVKVFFDGKFLDIPNTVAKASEAIVSRGVFMFNVHACGGAEMLSATAQAANQTAKKLDLPPSIILGVTVLTSMSEKVLDQEVGVSRGMNDQVVHLALMAKNNGLTGVVASAAEAKLIRSACGPEFVIVTPGVRPAWSSKDDQVRIVTPGDAIANGADYIVVGRPITAAAQPKEAAKRLLDEIEIL